jgi:hypothetical protein
MLFDHAAKMAYEFSFVKSEISLDAKLERRILALVRLIWSTTMEALLAKYLAKPTIQNAERVRVYNKKHPMAVCLLVGNGLEMALLNEAIEVATNKGVLKLAA